MNTRLDLADPLMPPASGAASAPGADMRIDAVEDLRLWQGGWALGVAAVAAAMLAIFGGLTGPTLVGLAAAALPGAAGYVFRLGHAARNGVLIFWALTSVVAAGATGGATGPLAVWCATPLLLGALLGGLPQGAALSGAALVTILFLEAAGIGPMALGGVPAVVLATLTLALLLAAAGGAILLLKRQASVTGLGLSPEMGDFARFSSMSRERALETDRLKALVERVRELEMDRDRAEAARAQAEEARAQAEAAAAAKARFLANMSHELRTPLNAIMGFSDIMRARMFGELAPKYGEYAELIHESGGHLVDLINDVLDMSKIEAERYTLSPEVFDARDAVSAALRLMRLQADEGGVQLRGLMPQQALTVEADRRAVKQIVLNLVSNALKFTPPAGSVTVTAQSRGGDLELVVADTGTGIAPEDLERLGRPFEQAGDADQRAQGTGLGLSLVKAFAGLHGGSMSIESALGEGAAVTVRLPVVRPAPEASEPAAAPVEPARATGTVIPLPLSRQP